MSSRRLVLALCMALVLLATWSVGIEPRWVAAREIDHAVPGWRGPPGMKVAIAADWHVTTDGLRRVMTPQRARAIVDAINAAAPDVVLLPGDFLAEKYFEVEPGAPPPEEQVAAILGRLRAPLGVYAVLGNHDWWHGGERLAAALRARGIVVLENDARPIDAGLWVVGIGDDHTGHADPRAAFAKVPAQAQVLALMHDPASLPQLPAVNGVVVAGHTHGGQVALPFFGAPIVPGRAPRAWARGWVHHGPNTMYVTTGLGVSILPLRFNARPEWVLMRMGAALG